LLEQFLSGDGESAEGAFAVLVARHGAMVLGVCRRVLGNRHAAEDAFQATFLVLARKAAGIARREQLACWLHGVARRAALDARARASRQRAGEKRLGAMSTFEKPGPSDTSELRAILDQELSRLPERHRAAIVLCELEGLSRREAAGRLGVSEGTLSSRLARAKRRLRDRLTERGVALSAAALAAALTSEAHAVPVSPALADSTVRIVSLVASGTSLTGAVSTSVVTLTEGVLKTMLLGKLKFVILTVAAVAVISTGVGVGAQDRPSDEDRLRAVERKLDRLLEVLERSVTRSASSPFASGDTFAPESATPKVAAPVVTAKPALPAISAGPTPSPMPEARASATPATTPVAALAPVVAQGPHPQPLLPPAVPPPAVTLAPALAAPGQISTPHPYVRQDQPNSLAARVERLERRLNDLERALASLEGRLRGSARPGARPSRNVPLQPLPPAPVAAIRGLPGPGAEGPPPPPGAPSATPAPLPPATPAPLAAPGADVAPVLPEPPAPPEAPSADTAPFPPTEAAPSPPADGPPADAAPVPAGPVPVRRDDGLNFACSDGYIG
jgi:RNA polymerase sigma factor (sigma-70 family)